MELGVKDPWRLPEEERGLGWEEDGESRGRRVGGFEITGVLETS